MLILYRPDGQPLLLEESLWISALETAREFGWRPAGTLAPPGELAVARRTSWHGEYATAAGQEVRRADAAQFSLALARSGEAQFAKLREFSRSSGFLICAPVAGWPLPKQPDAGEEHTAWKREQEQKAAIGSSCGSAEY